jgi:hypothetical protein
MRDKELMLEDVETSHTRWSGGRWYLRRGDDRFGSSRVECVAEKRGESET